MPEGSFNRRKRPTRGKRGRKHMQRRRRVRLLPSDGTPAPPVAAAAVDADTTAIDQPQPCDVSPDELDMLAAAFNADIHADAGVINWTLKRDARDNLPSEREVLAALRVLNKHKSAFELPRVVAAHEPVAGEWWVWDAHRGNEPGYLPPGLGFSFDKIAGIPTVDPKVPLRVRRYLSGRSKKADSRRQIAMRAFQNIEKYRRKLEDQKNHLWFSIVARTMIDPESQPKQ